MNIGRYWVASISKLNDHIKKLGLTDFQVIRKTEENGQEFIEVREAMIPPSIPSSRSHGYGVIQEDRDFNLADMQRLEEKTEAFLDGAKYVLDFYHFRKNGNFDRFKRLANDFDFIFRNFKIDNREEVNLYLWNNLALPRIIAQAHYQLRQIFGQDLKFELAVAGVAEGNSISNRRLIYINPMIEDTPENRELLDGFREDWWAKNTENVKDILFLFQVLKAKK